MNLILVLTDFTTTASKAVEQAIAIAKKHKASIMLCHIAEKTNKASEDELATQLAYGCKQATDAGVSVSTRLAHGPLHATAAMICEELHPDLVVVGTHGKESIHRDFLGSAIHKLVKELPGPTLVVNEFTQTAEEGFKVVMLPVGAHPDYASKVQLTSKLLAKDGKIVIFAIVHENKPLSPAVQQNVALTKQMLKEQGIQWDYKEVPADRYSLGFAQQTLAATKSENMDLISIMSQVSHENRQFGKMDKESILLNEMGIPVLCTNSPN